MWFIYVEFKIPSLKSKNNLIHFFLYDCTQWTHFVISSRVRRQISSTRSIPMISFNSLPFLIIDENSNLCGPFAFMKEQYWETTELLLPQLSDSFQQNSSSFKFIWHSTNLALYLLLQFNRRLQPVGRKTVVHVHVFPNNMKRTSMTLLFSIKCSFYWHDRRCKC